MRKAIVDFSKKQITRYGLVLNQVQSKLIHWAVFPWITETWGLEAGCAFLVVAISLMCLVQLHLYNKAQSVLQSVEVIHRVERGEVKTLLQWALWFLLKCNRFFVLFGLGTQFDPFIVIIFMKDSKRLTWHPAIVFAVSLTVGMIYTILLSPYVSQGLKFVMHYTWQLMLNHPVWSVAVLATISIYSIKPIRIRIRRFISG